MLTIDLDAEFASSAFICPAEWTPESEVAEFVENAKACFEAMGFDITEVTPTSVHFRTTYRDALERGFSREAVASALFSQIYRERQREFSDGTLDYFAAEHAVYSAVGATLQ